MILYDKQMIELLIEHFGVRRILAALPQREVVSLLGLVSVRKLADDLSLRKLEGSSTKLSHQRELDSRLSCREEGRTVSSQRRDQVDSQDGDHQC